MIELAGFHHAELINDNNLNILKLVPEHISVFVRQALVVISKAKFESSVEGEGRSYMAALAREQK